MERFDPAYAQLQAEHYGEFSDARAAVNAAATALLDALEACEAAAAYYREYVNPDANLSPWSGDDWVSLTDINDIAALTDDDARVRHARRELLDRLDREARAAAQASDPRTAICDMPGAAATLAAE